MPVVKDDPAPHLDTSLLPIYQQWVPAKGDLSLWNYLNLRAEYDLAAAFSKLFWPDFIEVSGCILLAEQYDPSSFKAWWEVLEGKLQAVEALVNHVHIYDLFLNSPPDVKYDDRLYDYLGRILLLCWRHALHEAFPEKEFAFVYSTDPAEYGPTITFSQAS
jgi:hypothetical protein